MRRSGVESNLSDQKQKWQSRTKRDLIIEVWEALDCESVGERELVAIQEAMREALGPGAVESPAAIARVVADEGATLRHPEVFECDLKWREGKLNSNSKVLDFSSFATALDSFSRIEVQRQELQRAKDPELNQLRETIAAMQEDCLLIGRSKIITARQREEAKEIAEWLRVWLLTPDLFRDWLDLRMRSDEFRKRFGAS